MEAFLRLGREGRGQIPYKEAKRSTNEAGQIKPPGYRRCCECGMSTGESWHKVKPSQKSLLQVARQERRGCPIPLEHTSLKHNPQMLGYQHLLYAGFVVCSVGFQPCFDLIFFSGYISISPSWNDIFMNMQLGFCVLQWRIAKSYC